MMLIYALFLCLLYNLNFLVFYSHHFCVFITKLKCDFYYDNNNHNLSVIHSNCGLLTYSTRNIICFTLVPPIVMVKNNTCYLPSSLQSHLFSSNVKLFFVNGIITLILVYPRGILASHLESAFRKFQSKRSKV